MADKVRKLGMMYLFCAGLLVLTVFGCLLFVQRDQMLVYWYSGELLATDQPKKDTKKWLADRQMLSMPVVMGHLADADPARAARAGAFIQSIVAEHADPTDPDDSHLSLSVAAKLHQLYAQLPSSGRLQAERLALQVLDAHLSAWSPSVPTALETAGEVIFASLQDSDVSLREQALRSIAAIWKWNGSDEVVRSLVEEWKRGCYQHAVAQLKSDSPTLRAAAAAAIAGSPFHEGDIALIENLDDDHSEVQKSALIALSYTESDSFTSDQKTHLVQFLYDKDPEVRQAATQVLMNSGVSEAVIHLAKLMKSPQPTERAKVAALAFSVPEIDPVRWVLELSDDPSPAVRLAVARVACKSKDPDLRAKLQSMAKSDPDENVRTLSQQFLQAHSN